MSFKQGLWLVIESASVFMAIVVFIVGMDWVANDEPYTGGIYAPLMALCAALLLLLNSVDVDASKRQKAFRGAFAAIFGGISAYFWIADEIGNDPPIQMCGSDSA